MKDKYNLIAGILCYFMSVIYLLCALFENSLPYAIGFIFWVAAGFLQIETHRNNKRK